uniref:Uncharacterized protein n=1 Tax=Anopheles albimanus TaxID=7167 RepID=A0A182FX44_ANOAL
MVTFISSISKIRVRAHRCIYIIKHVNTFWQNVLSNNCTSIAPMFMIKTYDSFDESTSWCVGNNRAY